MRNAFADEIYQLAKADPRIVLLSGDIGNRLFDKFKLEMPTRFYNCGIAEANMVSMAAGLASTGLRPLCYTITPFVTTRALEQIKLDVCYHNMPVTIVGTGSGLSYASLGSTHHSFEDIAILRPLPGLRIFAPADGHEVRGCLKEAFSKENPTYIRIGKKGEPFVHSAEVACKAGDWNEIPHQERESFVKKVLILGSGKATHTGQAVAEVLANNDVETRVVSCFSVKPLDESWLTESRLAGYDLVVTMEDHSIIGGFGSAVAEHLIDSGISHPRILRIGIPDEFLHDCGEEEEAHVSSKTDSDSVAAAILSRLQLS